MGGVTGTPMKSGIWVATFEELAMLTAEALVSRSETQDRADLLWILQRMEAKEYQFGRDVQGIFIEARKSVVVFVWQITRQKSWQGYLVYFINWRVNELKCWCCLPYWRWFEYAHT
jgi:hypothetical protein